MGFIRHNFKNISVFVVSTIFFFALVFPAFSWQTETVDQLLTGGNSGNHCSMAQDALGNIHISSYNGYPNSGSLLYMTNASGEWTKQIIDSGGKVGEYSSIAVTNSGIVHISYSDATNYVLKYATNASGNWQIVVVDQNMGSGYLQSSICLDNNGKVHISYYDSRNGDLKYATNSSGQWVTTTLDSQGYVGEGSSIAIDKSNNVHISYYDATNADLKYATNVSGSWEISTLDSGAIDSASTSIALDNNDKVYICYVENHSSQNYSTLKYCTNVSGGWVIREILNDWWVRYPHLALDSQNNLHIIYDITYANQKYYSTNASGTWEHTRLDASNLFSCDIPGTCTGANNGYSSIIVDSNNKVHMCYSADTIRVGISNDIKYLTNITGDWVETVIDTYGEVGEYASLALDSNDKAHISYSDATNGNLKYATNTSGNWVTTVVDHSIISDLYNTIALDNIGNAHIGYKSWPQTIKYANNASGNWVTEVVDASGNLKEGISIVVDDSGFAHISYDDFGSLKYATNKTGSWIVTALDGIAWNSGTSITLDSSGKIYISYTDGQNLKCATNRTGSWQIITADSGVSLGFYSSIALDSNNKIHISYYDAIVPDLKYASDTSGQWVRGVVDSTRFVGKYSSITIDDRNIPHISYFDEKNQVLKYATKIYGTWRISVADGRFLGAGEYSSIANNQNNIHISHHGADGTLLYTTGPIYRPSGGGCFLSGTAILMADGKTKPIEKIEVGDIVKSVDSKGDIVENKVTKLLVHPDTKGYLLVETADGRKLEVTKEHRVKSGSDYKAIGTLTIDSPITLLKEGKLIETRIISMRKINTAQTVYNFEVENSHTYFANGYLVHNRKPIIMEE